MSNRVRNKHASWRRIRGQTLGTVSIIPFLVMGVGRAHAQPVGAAVIAGQAQVSTSGATTIINQATNKAIINWQDFSVGTGASVQFNQPNSASITLNRVTGANISNIDGAVRANGQVWLLNPNGVLFGNNARINVGGLLATTSDIANQDFLEGRYNFTGGKNSIINKGSIQASSGGSVVLSAPNVANHGLIQANAGHVVLGGTDTFTVDFNGDRLLSYAVGANSSGGKVTNTGKISAPGGQILLTARAAAGVQEAVINNTGMVEATSVREENGEIVLEAEDGGVANSGTLDASGKGAGETGGTVKLLGKDIAVTDGARIDVSGDAGGGTALIGGNFQGKGSEQHAQTTTIGKASIKADAISRGNGGKVAVWSDGTTQFAGSISAKGGAASGNGGQVETSGHHLGIADGVHVDTGAAHGSAGDWLLDPDFINIQTSGGCTILGDSACADNSFSTTGTSTINPSAISDALVGSNVTLQANIDITVSNSISATSSHTLTLTAGHSIIVNASIDNFGGGISLKAGEPAGSGSGMANPMITTANGSVVISASNIQLNLPQGTGSIGTNSNLINLEGVDSGGFDIPLDLTVSTNGASAYVNVASAATLTSLTNLSGGALTLMTGGDLTVNGAITTAGSDTDVFLSAGDSLQLNADVFNNGGNVYLQANANFDPGATSISGTGLVTGNIVAMQLNSNPASPSTGSIGTLAQPINISGVGSDVGLAVSTGGQDVFVNSQSGVIIYSVDSFLGIQGVNLSDGGGGAGNFTLAASGNITQSNAITATNLSITTLDANQNITLDGSDNQVGGALHFVTTVSGDVIFNDGFADPVTLGASNVGGALQVNATGALSIADALPGATVTATGAVTLTAGLDIHQGASLFDATNSIPIVSNGLTVTTNGGAIALTDARNAVMGGVDVQPDFAHPGQFIETPLGVVSLSGVGSIAFTNAAPTVLGAVTVTQDSDHLASLDIAITDPIGAPSHSNLYLTNVVNVGDTHSGSSLPADSGTGVITIHTAGDIVNLQGHSQIFGDELNLISDFGNIGGEEPSGGSSYFMSTNINALHIQQSGDSHGLVTYANLSNGSSYQVGTSQGGIDIGNGSILLGADNQGGAGMGTNTAVITQLSDPTGKIIAGSLSVASGGGYTLENEQNLVGAFASYTQGSGSFFNSGGLSIAGISGNLFDSGVMPSGSVSITAVGGDLTVNGAINAAAGSAVFLHTTGSINVNANITADDPVSGVGSIYLFANDSGLDDGIHTSDTNGIFGSGTLKAGNITLDVGASNDGLSGGIGTANAPLHLDTHNSDGDLISLSVKTFGGDVYLDSAKAVSFDLPFDQSAAGVSVDLTNEADAPTGSLFLTAGAFVTQTYGIAVRDLSLAINHEGDISLNSQYCNCGSPDPGNLVEGVMRFNTVDGNVGILNERSAVLGASSVRGSLTVNAFSIQNVDAAIQIDDPNGGQVMVQGDLNLNADTGIVQGATPLIVSGNLSATGYRSSITLANSANAIHGAIQITSAEDASIDLANSVDTTITQLRGTTLNFDPALADNITVNVSDPHGLAHPGLTIQGAVEAQDPVILAAAGDLILAGGASIFSGASAGDAITLAAGGHFINQAGSSVLSLGEGTGRWLIYSADPAGDTFGQLNSMNTAVFGVTYPTGVSDTGNRYAFAQGGTLTITAANASKVYGVDDSAALSAGYTLTATNAGDFPEAFLPSSGAVTYSGTPSITSLGSGSSAHVGTYDITAGLGSLQVSGYQLVFVKGTLTITPATLTYTANAASRTYGAVNPLFAGTVSGFVNGDTLAKATSGTLFFASAANAASGVGSYAISGSGLSAGDYIFAQAANNATALTITPATLLYVANAASRALGDPNPVFSGNVTGFVNNETQASATRGTLVFSSTAAPTSAVGRYAINGSGLTASNYVFVQAPANLTALTITAPVTPPLDTSGLADTAETVLVGFIAGLKPPPLGNTILDNQGPASPQPPAPPPPAPPPPPPPPGGSPLADNNTTADGQPAEEPNSSDQATNEVVASLDGGSPAQDGGGPIIPGMLNGAPPPPPPPPVDAGALPGFGNSALWQ